MDEHVRAVDEKSDLIAERVREIAAECWAAQLVDALCAALANDKNWRREAQALLQSIDRGELPTPKPTRRY